MPIRAVILDWDGTIYDSSSLKTGGKRAAKIVEGWGYKVPGDIFKKLRDNSGLGGIKMLGNSFGLNTNVAEKVYREWERIDEVKFFPLIRKSKSVLKKLESSQIKVLLLTSRNRKNLIRVLDHFELTALFNFVQASDDWSFEKPDPHVFCFVLHLLAKSGIRLHECIYVGDTIRDFECTTARGLISVSVTTGVFSKSDFTKAGQKKENIIRSIADLPEWINKYGRA